MICPECGEGKVVQTYHDIEIKNYGDSNGYDYYKGMETISVPKANHFHCNECGKNFTKKTILLEEEES